MDEYNELVMPAPSIFKDILALIAEHSITMTDTRNKDILQDLINRELEVVNKVMEIGLIYTNQELAEAKRKQIKTSQVTQLKGK